MKILITGANGFVGTYLSHYLRNLGHDVLCAVRNKDKAVDGFNNIVVENMSSADAWHPALETNQVVIHLIAKTHSISKRSLDDEADYTAVNVDITRALCTAVKSSCVRHFIFMSSIKVHGEISGPKPITETSPLTPKDSYGRTKLVAEQTIETLLEDSKIRYTIVRPPLIFSNEMKGNLALLEKSIRRGYPLPLAGLHNKRSVVRVDTLAEFLVTCLDYPKLSQGPFLVADTPPQSTTALIKRIGHSIGVKPKLFYVPNSLLTAIFNVIGRQDLIDKLLNDLEVDNTKSKHLLARRSHESPELRV